MVRRRRTPSPTWLSFLRNQAAGIAAIDMFVVACASFRLLYVLIILAHDRRKIVRFDVTPHPTAGWLARQVTEAFPWDTAPRYLLRDRDASYGQHFCRQVDAMGITEVVTAPRSPWQNAFVERVIGSIRRECLDYIIIFNERHLRRVLPRTSTTTIEPALIFRSTRIAPTRARSSHPGSEESSPSRKSVVCITATSVSPPDSPHLLVAILLRVAGTPAPEESLIGGFRSRTRLGRVWFNSQPVSFPRLNSTSVTAQISRPDGIINRDRGVAHSLLR